MVVHGCTCLGMVYFDKVTFFPNITVLYNKLLRPIYVLPCKQIQMAENSRFLEIKKI